MNKKILIITQNFYPEIGSAGNRMKNIYLLLKEKGYQVDVLTTDPTYPNRKFYEDESFWDHEELNESPDINRIKIKKRKYSRSFTNRLFFYLEMAWKMIGNILKSQKKYDYVYTTSPAIFIALVGLLAKYKFRAKLILEIRDLWPDSLKGVGVFNYPFIIKFFTKIEQLLYRKANEIVVNSLGFVNHIKASEEKAFEKITYIPNAARKNEINPMDGTNSSFKAIYAGNLGLAQDNDILLNLAEKLYDRNVELTIMGYGYFTQKLKEAVKKKKLKNVKFVHPRSRAECFTIIADHQVGLVTLTDKEVFKTVLPGKIIDYMTCGVPIVGSVDGFSKQVIEEQKAGFVSNSKGVDELLVYIDKLKNDPLLQKRMSDNGNQYVKEHFLWEKNIHSLVDVLEPQKKNLSNTLSKVEL
ncbi:glycosyltransferase family 4 protein [Halobacillus yeomjeoni]|uniref:Glycosyltransferase family 4 protein n=1 Tax=Halobacillus yeomjeoni TaxID=311194 RepID=A0A931MVT3_9BACI|nr:glycosyltransferase family 4 protein [Halobacillus yeomjeoni]MBH0230729.1 glycosyltransferase family 4 protein [Halobacillus yeomjeoni]